MRTLDQKPTTIGAFDSDVVHASGRIDTKALATALDLSLPQLASILGVTPRTLQRTDTSKAVQPAAKQLVQMMNELAEALGERRFAIHWLTTPQRQLSSETPLSWLLKGGFTSVNAYVDSFVRMQPD
jgi:transcriptional regulator with XRE-family HTH domain